MKSCLRAAVCGVTIATVAAWTHGEEPGRRADFSKRQVEAPAKHLLADAIHGASLNPISRPATADLGKGVIERPIKAVAAASSASNPTSSKIAPGAVNWHRDFAQAKIAAEKSGKPIFLFHLLGKLDEVFC
jgi:hypothetical protein